MNQKLLRGILIEFGPITLFLVTFEFFGFIIATTILVASTILGLLTAYFLERRLALFPLLTGLFTVTFGAASVLLDSPRILVVEYTLYTGLLGIVLLIGLLYDRGVLKDFFDSLFALTERGWLTLSLRWGILLVVVAVLNELVWFYFSLHTWVVFRFLLVFVFLFFFFSQLRVTVEERLPGSSPVGLRLK